MIKNFLILGDSYSTHRDYIPKEYPHYYSSEGGNDNNPSSKMTPSETWWGHLIENTDARLVFNDSWSGSTIGYTGYAGDCSKTSSFIYRYNKMLEGGFFAENEINTIFVFGGTNDSWANAPLGEEQYAGWERRDLFSVLPAICYLMATLKNNHPNTRIVFIANCGIKPEIIECMKNASKRIGVECVELRDIDKRSSHPTVLGMEQIYSQIVEQL
jgi:hypothetical protein